jgi:hypothetical protein
MLFEWHGDIREDYCDWGERCRSATTDRRRRKARKEKELEKNDRNEYARREKKASKSGSSRN